MAIEVLNPFEEFHDTSGSPLDNGYIYIGTEGQNPETNPIAIYWDNLLTIPAANPVRTISGYPSRNGSPARIYASATFSITVKDSQSKLVYSSLIGNKTSYSTTIGTIASLRLTPYVGQQIVSVTGYYTAADNIGVREYYWDATSTETDNGGTIIQVTGVATGRWKMKYNEIVNLDWFGVISDGVDLYTYKAVINSFKDVRLSKRNYTFTQTDFLTANLHIPKDCRITISATKTLTLYGEIIAGRYLIFALTGVVFPVKNSTMPVEWFLNPSGGSDNTTALQRVLDISGYTNTPIDFGTFTCSIFSPVRFMPNTSLHGFGLEFASVIELRSTGCIKIDGTSDRVTYGGVVYRSKTTHYSATTPNLDTGNWEVSPYGTWALGEIKHIGYTVTGTDGNKYICKKYHITTANDQPVTGINYATYWELVNPSAWDADKIYNGGSWTFRNTFDNIQIAHNACTAPYSVLVNAAYNVTVRDIFLLGCPNNGIETGLITDSVIENPVVYGSDTVGSTGILINSSGVKVYNPDVEAFPIGMEVKDDAVCSVYSPYIERCANGIKGSTSLNGSLNVYGINIQAPSSAIIYNGENIHVHGGNTQDVGYMFRSDAVKAFKSCSINNVVTTSALHWLDTNSTVKVNNCSSGVDSAGSLLKNGYKKTVYFNETAADNTLTNMFWLDLRSNTSLKVNVTGTITITSRLADIGVASNVYRFAMFRTNTSPKKYTITFTSVFSSNSSTAAYTTVLTPSFAEGDDFMVFQVTVNNSGTSGEGLPADIFAELDITYNDPDFKLTIS